MASSTNGICSKKTCEEPAAPDSVRCVRHRDEQRASNEAYRARQNEKDGKPAPQRRGRKSKTTTPLAVPVIAGTGGSWKNEVLACLSGQRTVVEAQLASIDQAIETIKGI